MPHSSQAAYCARTPRWPASSEITKELTPGYHIYALVLFSKSSSYRQKVYVTGFPMNSKGQTLCILLVFMSLILTLASVFIVSCLSVTRLSIEHSRCRKIGLLYQKKQTKYMKRLLRLNPKAKILLTKEFAAKARLAIAITSGQPVAILAAQAGLARVQGRQQILGLKQKSILIGASLEKSQMYATVRSNKRIFFPIQPALAVRPIPRGHVAPYFKVLLDFENLQRIEIQIQFQIFKGIQKWILQKLNPNTVIKLNCATSFNQEMKLKLIQAKSF